jgi:two-component system response regulator Irr
MEVFMAAIMIVEDNHGTNKAICEYMKSFGHSPIPAHDGEEALRLFRDISVDLVILDIMLPKISGIAVLHEVRKNSNVPVIMLTAVEDEYTQASSFDELADDYMTKPFSMLLLGKRVISLLRRSENKSALNKIQIGDVAIDFAGYTASNSDGKIDITPKEMEILKLLIDNKGRVLSRNQILDAVWGEECVIIDRTIDAYIRNLRKKLNLDCIITIKGIGYKFEIGENR